MFITEEITPGEMLAEILKGQRVRPEATKRFAALKHDRDLCPKFTSQVKSMLDVYRAYGQDVHDVQGFHDNGIDILLTYEARDGTQRRAGLQIKSDEEFRRWEAKQLDLPKTLKAQFATAISDARVDDFYLVLCVDAVRHQKRIRSIKAALMNFKCTVVDPTDALGLFNLGGLDIATRVTRLLCHNDRVLKAAIAELDDELVEVAFFLVALVCQAFDGRSGVSQARLFDLWGEWEEFAGDLAGSEEHLSDVLAKLSDSGVLVHRDGEYVLAIDRLPVAVCALYFDQKVRAIERYGNFQEHILRLVDLRARLEIEEADFQRQESLE